MEFKYEGKSKSAGIYKITNILNERTYYGSAKCFQVRWSQHKSSLLKGKHSNRFLQADFDKCGSDVFIFEVLEVVEGDKTKRLEIEERYLKGHFDNGKQCYNLCDRAISRESFGDKKQRKTRSDKGTGKQLKYIPAPYPRQKQVPWNKGRTGCYSTSTLEKMKQSHTGKKFTEETIEKRRIKMIGQKRTSEQCERISKSLKGKTLGRKMTATCRTALLKANIGKKIPQKTKEALVGSRIQTYDVALINPDGVKFGPITNLSAFCREHCLERSLLIKVINGKRTHHKGWKLLTSSS